MEPRESLLARVFAVDELGWALVAWLTYKDKVWMWLGALESGLDDVACFLRYRATVCTFPDDEALVELAVSSHCFRAARIILEKTPSKDQEDPLEWMRWMSENYPREYTYNAIYRAAQNGDLPLVKWLHTSSTYDTSIATLEAARRGHVELAQWLLDHQKVSLEEDAGKAIHVAIPLGQLGVLVWYACGPYTLNQWFCVQTASGACVIENGEVNGLIPSRDYHDSTHVLEFAVFNGDISLVQRLYADGELCRDANLDDAASIAARLGHFDVLQWLHDECRVEFSARTIYMAARSGCLEMLRWIHACGTTETVDSDILLRAGVASTRREVVEWICTSHPSAQLISYPPYKIIGGVLEGGELLTTGELDVVGWLHDNGRVVSRNRLIEFACRCGKFSLLKELAKFDANTVEYWFWKICDFGDTGIEVVRFMVEELKVCTKSSFQYAVQVGNWQVAEYLYHINPRCRAASKSSTSYLIWIGRAAMVEWLYSVNKMFKYTPVSRLIGGHFRVASVSEEIEQIRVTKKIYEQESKNLAHWVLKHDDFSIKSLQTVAKWAAQRGHVDELRSATANIIARCNRSDRTSELRELLDVVITYTTLGDVVALILEQVPELADGAVSNWASLYGHSALLSRWTTKGG